MRYTRGASRARRVVYPPVFGFVRAGAQIRRWGWGGVEVDLAKGPRREEGREWACCQSASPPHTPSLPLVSLTHQH